MGRLKMRVEGTPPVLQRFLDRLEDVQNEGGDQFKARCPAHDDDHASLSVSWGEKGKVVLNCHAGCERNAIVQAVGVEWKELEQPRTIVAKYNYEDADGDLIYQVVRYEPKDFRQRQPDGQGGWTWGTKGVEPLPFNLPAIAEVVAHGTEDDTIWIPEGEKDCQAIEAAYEGNYATCNHGGAGKWTDEHSAWLKGFKGQIVIVADKDDKATKPGQKHALQVYESILHVTGLDAEIVYPAFGKDASDHVGNFGVDDFTTVTPDDLRAEIAEAASDEPSAEDERAAKVEEQAEWMRIQREARAQLAAEGWEPPLDQGSWAQQKDEPDQEIKWLIPELVFEGANVVVNAQAKSGKTSLILNVAHTLLSGEPLFGHFEVEAIPEGRSVAWWNAELFDRQAKAWLRDYDMPRPEAFFPLHLRGYAMPFDVATVEEWAVVWLSDRKVSVWLIDPQSALFTGEENSNTELGAWLGAIDRIKRRAGVETVFLVHHVAETSSEESDDPNAGRLLKGRGASRQTGWADVLWSYSGRFDEPRYLAALGRDVDLAPFGGLTLSPGSRMLRWNGKRMTPTQDRRHALALHAFDAVAGASEPLKSGELHDKLPGKKPDPKRRAVSYAIEQGWLVAEDGPRNSVLHSVGNVNPRQLSLKFVGSEAQ